MVLLSYFCPCSGQINVNETDRQRAEKSDVMHFFACMTNNRHYEKVAKNNHYIFDTINGKLYYGKVHSGFFKGKITDIFKIDVDVLQKQLPNFKKLHGFVLREIVLADIAKSNGLCNQSEIIVKNISFRLDTAIVVTIDFMINEKAQQKIYKLDTVDFSIVNG
jgi:hypothetical protein